MPLEPNEPVPVTLEAQRWNKTLEILWNQKHAPPIEVMPIINEITNQVQQHMQAQQQPPRPPGMTLDHMAPGPQGGQQPGQQPDNHQHRANGSGRAPADG